MYFKMHFYDAGAEFQHNYSSQCHTVLQKSFEYAYLLLNKHFLLLSMLKTGLLFNIWGIFFFFTIFPKDQLKVPKNSIYLKYK